MGRGTPLPIPYLGASVLHLLMLSRPTFHFFPTPMLCEPVAALLNASIAEGFVPTIWKSAEVVPVPKIHLLRLIESDLRPIWPLSVRAKTLEYFVRQWVLDKLEATFDPNQFGCLKNSGGGKGGEGACALGCTVQGAAFGWAKIWNSESWPLLANWRLHCRQWYFYTPFTLPSFGTTPPTVSVPRLHTNQRV